MDKGKQQRLQTAGWKVGSATEFLDLNEEEAALVEIELGLGSPPSRDERHS
jgi:hypothetical protein